MHTAEETLLYVVVIETMDEDEIEEVLPRLDNGEKLNAAESCRASPGNMSGQVRERAREPFFAQKFKFSNTRYRAEDVMRTAETQISMSLAAGGSTGQRLGHLEGRIAI